MPATRSLAELNRSVGGLSLPGKMPGYGFGLPALESCAVGSKLAELEGTPCSACYALKGRYAFPNVKAAQRRRLAILRQCETDAEAREEWVSAMTELISRRSPEFFRWHDSGDILGLWHLSMIVEVARQTPETRHWLPTQERRTVLTYLRAVGPFPDNLTVRVSAPRLGAHTTGMSARLPISTVTPGAGPTGAHRCPATEPGRIHTCEANGCRACWDPAVRWIDYRAH
jgi:hypothetical protein